MSYNLITNITPLEKLIIYTKLILLITSLKI